MNSNEVLVCITNHKNNENAFKLKEQLSTLFDVILIDSGSDDNTGFDVKLPNVYYTGLFNESVRLTKQRGKKYLYFIASDVFIDDPYSIWRCINDVGKYESNDNVYVWSPSSKGQSAKQCKNMNTAFIRDVNYVEGFTFLAKIDVLEPFYPVSLIDNKYGYGLDLLTGYYCKELGGRCVVDDRVEVYHKEGTGYDQKKAGIYMYDYLNKIGKKEVIKYLL